MKKIDYTAYVIAFLLVIIVFVLIISAGYYVARENVSSLDSSQRAISALFELFEIKNLGSLENVSLSCDSGANEVWKEKINIGAILENLEKRLGKNNKDVLEQKMVYNDIQLKLLPIVEKLNEQCDYNWSIILFVYSNDKSFGSPKLSEVQGNILSSYYEQNEDSLKVFSIDASLKTNLTLAVLDKYKIDYAPFLVIEGDGYKGVLSRYEIERIIEA